MRAGAFDVDQLTFDGDDFGRVQFNNSFAFQAVGLIICQAGGTFLFAIALNPLRKDFAIYPDVIPLITVMGGASLQPIPQRAVWDFEIAG
jgi:hypothetical protein